MFYYFIKFRNVLYIIRNPESSSSVQVKFSSYSTYYLILFFVKSIQFASIPFLNETNEQNADVS
jgi:hypothetical protein